ncbi:MAG: class II aldolase/adducin family protein [Coriobacteriia bacterium]|nr:class II aldolase/adducin family protein [Coriobacteriia bacterium]
MDFKRAQNTIIEFGKKLYDNHFISSFDGNISRRLENGVIVATATRTNKADLKPEDIVMVNLDGEALNEGKAPSSEIKMHFAIYRANPDVHAIIHTHPIFTTALAAAHMTFEPDFLDEATVYSDVPLLPYAPAGSQELADQVGEIARDHNAAILEKHGLVVWGSTLEETFFFTEKIEQEAHIYKLYRELMSFK